MRAWLRLHGVALVLGAALMALVLGAGIGGEAVFSSTTFCTSCHSMTYPAQELAKSNHRGALGFQPECRDCHIPAGIENVAAAVGTHVVDGLRGIIGEVRRDLSDIAKFDAHRLEFAHNARMNLKKWDSVTCRSCHRDPRPPGKAAREAHAKMAGGGATCIDCHQNLVHKKAPETDLDASRAAGRMVLKTAK